MTAVTAPPDLAALYAAHRHSLVRLAVLLVDDLASVEDVVRPASELVPTAPADDASWLRDRLRLPG